MCSPPRTPRVIEEPGNERDQVRFYRPSDPDRWRTEFAAPESSRHRKSRRPSRLSALQVSATDARSPEGDSGRARNDPENISFFSPRLCPLVVFHGGVFHGSFFVERRFSSNAVFRRTPFFVERRFSSNAVFRRTPFFVERRGGARGRTPRPASSDSAAPRNFSGLSEAPIRRPESGLTGSITQRR